VSISTLAIRVVIIAAVLVALVAVGRWASPKQGPTPVPLPRSEVRRGFARTHPWTLLVIIVATLFVFVAGPYVMFIGTMWLACRGGGSC
jgi:hypothetical protein